MGNCLKSCQDCANKHQAHLEINTNLLGTDVDAPFAITEAEISQQQQRQRQAEEAFIKETTNKHQALLEKTTIFCEKVIEGAGDRVMQRFDESAETHRRDIALLANIAIGDISQQQQHVDEDFRKTMKKILLKHHLESNSYLSLGPFFPGDDTNLEEFYVPPRLSELMKQRRSNNNGTIENQKRPITSLEELLTHDDPTNQFTIITANAGVGKTSFCKFIAVLWCACHNNKKDTVIKLKERFDIRFESLEDIPYLLYIPMRDIPPDRTHSIEDIVFAHLENVIGYRKKDLDKLETVFIDERCLVILDGMDESSLSILNPPKATRKFSIIITCRPWKLADVALPKCMHVIIDDLSQTLRTQLFEHANKRLNEFYGTAFKVEDFFATLEAQELLFLSSNTLVGLQLYCLWQDQHTNDETPVNSKTVVSLGRTRAHIYADILEMMFDQRKNKQKENSERPQTPARTQRTLPTCFEGRKLCEARSCLLYETGNVALKMLIHSKSDFDEETMISLQDEQYLLDSGLISAERSHKCGIRKKVYRFLHKTYQEMLAALYISSLNFQSKDWLAFQNNFSTVLSPDIMSFLCVMNYEQGQWCSKMFGDLERDFYRNDTFHTDEITDYQAAVQLAYIECINNGMSNPQLTLRHAWLDGEHDPAIQALLQHSLSKLKSCAIQCSEENTVKTCMIGMKQLKTLMISSAKEDDTVPQTIPTTFLNKLTVICLFNLYIENDNLNLGSCESLKVLILQNISLKHVTIASTQLEEFWVSIKNNMREKTTPMEVTFAHGEQCLRKLRELRLDNVILKETLNLQQCD